MKEKLERLVTFWESVTKIRNNSDSYSWRERVSAREQLALYQGELNKLK